MLIQNRLHTLTSKHVSNKNDKSLNGNDKKKTAIHECNVTFSHHNAKHWEKTAETDVLVVSNQMYNSLCIASCFPTTQPY